MQFIFKWAYLHKICRNFLANVQIIVYTFTYRNTERMRRTNMRNFDEVQKLFKSGITDNGVIASYSWDGETAE